MVRALFGVAVLNGLVLVHGIAEQRRAGVPLQPAVFDGALPRMRESSGELPDESNSGIQ